MRIFILKIILFCLSVVSVAGTTELLAVEKSQSFANDFVAIQYFRHKAMRNPSSYEILIHKNGNLVLVSKIASTIVNTVEKTLNTNQTDQIIGFIEAAELANKPSSHLGGNDSCSSVFSSGEIIKFLVITKTNFTRNLYYSGCIPKIPAIEKLAKEIDLLVGTNELLSIKND